MRHSRSSQVIATLLLSELLASSAAFGQTQEAPKPEPAPKQAAPAAQKPTASKKTESVPAPTESAAAAPPAPTAGDGGDADKKGAGTDTPAPEPGAKKATAATSDDAPPDAPATAEPRAAPEPSPPTPLTAGPAAAGAYPIRIESPIPGLQLQLHRIQLGDIEHSPTQDYDAFVDACASPCQTTVEAGAYQLAVRTPTGERGRANTGLLLQGPATVNADVVSNAEIRRQGWYWVVIGSTVGAIAASVGFAQNCNDNSCAKQAAMGIWGGITVMSVSWLIGFPKIRTEDEVNITISPGIASTGQSAALHQRHEGAF